MLLRESTKQGS